MIEIRGEHFEIEAHYCARMCMCNITLSYFKGDPRRDEKGDVLGSWRVRSETYQDKKMALEV